MTHIEATRDTRRAYFIYEVCRLEAEMSGRDIVPESWPTRDFDFQKQFIETIERLCADDAPATTPEAEHDSWMRAYKAMGWKYGERRDPIAKTHPDMVPFEQLSASEQIKDAIFLEVCALAKRYIR